MSQKFVRPASRSGNEALARALPLRVLAPGLIAALDQLEAAGLITFTGSARALLDHPRAGISSPPWPPAPAVIVPPLRGTR